MAQYLIIFDYSGSMNGERYQKCRQACLPFKEPFELWLFGDDVQKKGVVSSIPEFTCNSGTSISKMLETLHVWMSSNYNKYVFIYTDGEDEYDEAYFTSRFNTISDHHHQVTVYDICGRNVDPLKRIFQKFAISVTDSYEEVTKLIARLQQVMTADRELMNGVTNLNDNVQSLIKNYAEINVKSEELKKITIKLKQTNQTTISAAEKALADKTVLELHDAAEKLKSHINELADHVEKLEENQTIAGKLELDAKGQTTKITKLKTKINGEKISSNANLPKIAGYEADIVKHERTRDDIMVKVEELKRTSAAVIEDFEQLQEKTADVQAKVTETLKTI